MKVCFVRFLQQCLHEGPVVCVVRADLESARPMMRSSEMSLQTRQTGRVNGDVQVIHDPANLRQGLPHQILIQHDMQVTPPAPQRPQPVLVKLVPAKNRSEGEFSKRRATKTVPWGKYGVCPGLLKIPERNDGIVGVSYHQHASTHKLSDMILSPL